MLFIDHMSLTSWNVLQFPTIKIVTRLGYSFIVLLFFCTRASWLAGTASGHRVFTVLMSLCYCVQCSWLTRQGRKNKNSGHVFFWRGGLTTLLLYCPKSLHMNWFGRWSILTLLWRRVWCVWDIKWCSFMGNGLTYMWVVENEST